MMKITHGHIIDQPPQEHPIDVRCGFGGQEPGKISAVCLMCCYFRHQSQSARDAFEI